MKQGRSSSCLQIAQDSGNFLNQNWYCKPLNEMLVIKTNLSRTHIILFRNSSLTKILERPRTVETIVLWVVSGHLIMLSPKPYSNNTLNNSLLAYDGSDFPCKLRTDAFLAPTKETVYQVGVVNTIRFEGSVTHGGGSCQLSLTEDLAPSTSVTDQDNCFYPHHVTRGNFVVWSAGDQVHQLNLRLCGYTFLFLYS